jgi:hypothetical protein
MASRRAPRKKDILTNDGRVRVLIAVYNQAYSEVTRCRDMQWKVAAWTVVLLASAIGVAKGLGMPAQFNIVFKTLLFVFSLLVVGYGCWYLHYFHDKLIWSLNVRRDVERLFELYKAGAYDSKSILPEKFAKEKLTYKKGVFLLISGWVFVLVVAGYALASIWVS